MTKWQHALLHHEQMQREVRRAAEVVTSTSPFVDDHAREVAREHLAALIHSNGK